MELTELADWTPHRARFGRNGALLDWVDLRGLPFRAPFLLQTIDAAIAAGRTVFSAPLASLHALEQIAPGRDPDGFIFHMSRCGSTLVSRQIGLLPGTLVASEPDSINDLLELDVTEEDEPALVELLRLTVRALGRRRPEGENHYVLKLSSFCICRAALLRRAFPEVPFVFVSRAPLEVLGSVLASPPGWVQLIRYPVQACILLRIPEAEVTMDDPESFLVRGLAGFVASALEMADERMLLVDYTELPEAIPDRILPHLGIALTGEDRERLAAESRFDAKAVAGRQVFIPDSARKRNAVPPEIAALSAQWLDPLHAEIEAQRQAALGRNSSGSFP